METTFDKVKSVVMDVMQKKDGSDLTMDTRFDEDLKADSMDKFFLIEGLTDMFNITISDEDAKKIKTIGDVVNILTEKGL